PWGNPPLGACAIATSSTYFPSKSTMSNTTFEANDHQYFALKQAKDFFGQRWKSKLRTCWETGRYPSSLSQYKAELQQVRNQAGANWLTRFRFEG
ncbi:hypothetical protein, partial [Nodosilinea sp. LEGE 07298]|uniref:hypothetical protein n=1 Tax=Nodosilinea sp. LEGE 07298 TaxID=2777970 RepID=UPI001D14E6F9